MIDAYQENEDHYEINMSKTVGSLVSSHEKNIENFNKRQAINASDNKNYLKDGRIDTISEEVLAPRTEFLGASPGAALLGIHPAVRSLVPKEMDDQESYITILDDGPPHLRSFGTATSLLIYYHPLNLMEIVWVGSATDTHIGFNMVNENTEDRTSWASINRQYQDIIEQKWP